MVHALKEIRRLFQPGGFLIDIHPVREAPYIKVYQGRDLLFAESDPGYDYDEDLQHAEDALEDVIQRGAFRIEGKDEFELVTYGSSASEMQDYWAEYGAFDDEPKDNVITLHQNEVYARANEIMQNAPGAEITYHERARITLLKPTMKTSTGEFAISTYLHYSYWHGMINPFQLQQT